MLTIRETLVRLFAACGAMDINECTREVRTQATVALPPLRTELRDVVRAELESMERESLCECDWIEPAFEDEDGYHAWDLTPAGYALAATYR